MCISICTKQRTTSLFLFVKNEIDYNIFKTLRTSCKTKATLCYEKFIEGVERSVLSNINFFGDYINIRRNTKGYPSSYEPK